MLISGLVAYRIGLALNPQIKVETETVTEYITINEVREVLPPLPECANFDFNPRVGGMPMDEFIAWSAEVYGWGAGCSGALKALQE